MKKYCSAVAAILAILMIFSSISITGSFGTASAATQVGDINRDSIINQKDILALRKYLSKETTTKSPYADVYADDVINAKDVYYLKAYVAGIIDSIPVSADSTTQSTAGTTKPSQTTDPNLPSGVDPYYLNGLARVRTIEGTPYNTVAVNQVGYSVGADKIIKLVEGSTNTSAQTSRISKKVCYVVNTATNTAVYNKTSAGRKIFNKQIEGESLWVSTLDISDFDTPGTYRIYTPIGYSYEFKITDNAYSKVIDDLTMALYYQRCGGDITESVLQAYDDHLVEDYGATPGEYFNKYKSHARDACHLESNSEANKGQEVVVVDQYDPDRVLRDSEGKEHLGGFVANTTDGKLPASDGSNVKKYAASDFCYGLHDAGDYGRYTQPASQVVADLLYAYELYPSACTLDVVQDKPGENIPDVLDHARWEAKFLLNMQAPEGGFYFKICTNVFASATGSTPNNDKSFNSDGMRVTHVNFSATADAAAVLASCAYTFRDIDPDFAEECLAASEKAYEWWQANYKNGTEESNDRDTQAVVSYITPPEWAVGGGSYGGTAAESYSGYWYFINALYRVTGKNVYHTEIKNRASIYTANNSYPLDISAHTMPGAGTLAYVLTSKDGNYTTDPTIVQKCIDAFADSSVSNNSTSSSHVFNIAIAASGKYTWGSNNQFAVALKKSSIAERLKADSTSQSATNFSDAIRSNLNYMLGASPEGYCFITGMSEGSTKNIHHWPSSIIKRHGGLCVPGLLAGGYTEESASPVAEYSGVFRYRDDEGDFVCNEICVYWNSSAIFTFATVIAEDLA